MAQKTKVPYLETSQEKSRRMRGNGSSNMGSPTSIGNRTAAILRKTKDLYLPSEKAPGFQLDVISEMIQVQKDQTESGSPDHHENGSFGETVIDTSKCLGWTNPDQ